MADGVVVVDGNIGDIISLKPEIDSQLPGQPMLIRERKIGITMNIDQARSFVQWMQKKIDDYEKLLKKQKEKTQDEKQ